MDEALKTLAGQGVIGAMMVLLLFAIIYLQKKRDSEGEARLKETRETLQEAGETIRVVGQFRDTVVGLSTSMNSLTVTVQTMHADIKSAREQNKQRDDRVEAMIERNGGYIREIESVVRENNRLIERAKTQLDRIGAAER